MHTIRLQNLHVSRDTVNFFLMLTIAPYVKVSHEHGQLLYIMKSRSCFFYPMKFLSTMPCTKLFKKKLYEHYMNIYELYTLKLYEHYTLTNKGSVLYLMLYINSSYKAPFINHCFLTFKTTLKMYIHRKLKFFVFFFT